MSLSRTIRWLVQSGSILLGALLPLAASGGVVSTSGTVVVEPLPHAEPANGVIFVYDEQQTVPFVGAQPLEFGTIAPGTLVDSHYVQFDPVTSTGSVGAGSITFDGPILGLATATGSLTADLAPAVTGTSDTYFGLENLLGPYPTGAVASTRGLGSPQDNLVVNLGSTLLTIDSLQIPAGAGGNLDGFRVFTGSQSSPVSTHVSGWLLLIALLAIGGPCIARGALRES